MWSGAAAGCWWRTEAECGDSGTPAAERWQLQHGQHRPCYNAGDSSLFLPSGPGSRSTSEFRLSRLPPLRALRGPVRVWAAGGGRRGGLAQIGVCIDSYLSRVPSDVPASWLGVVWDLTQVHARQPQRPRDGTAGVLATPSRLDACLYLSGVQPALHGPPFREEERGAAVPRAKFWPF